MLGLITIIKTVKLLFEKSRAYFLFRRGTVMQIIKQLIYYFDMKSKPLTSPVPFT